MDGRGDKCFVTTIDTFLYSIGTGYVFLRFHMYIFENNVHHFTTKNLLLANFCYTCYNRTGTIVASSILEFFDEIYTNNNNYQFRCVSMSMFQLTDRNQYQFLR